MILVAFPRILRRLASGLPGVRRIATVGLRTRRTVHRLRCVFGGVGRYPRALVHREEGNAVVEFIGWSVILVVPVLYLVVALAQIQATTFAVASAADAASRVLEVDDSPSAMDKAQVALSDQGIDADPAGSLMVTCAYGCARGQTAVVKVAVGVDLPGFASLGIGRDVVVVDTERSITLPGKEEP